MKLDIGDKVIIEKYCFIDMLNNPEIAEANRINEHSNIPRKIIDIYNSFEGINFYRIDGIIGYLNEENILLYSTVKKKPKCKYME